MLPMKCCLINRFFNRFGAIPNSESTIRESTSRLISKGPMDDVVLPIIAKGMVNDRTLQATHWRVDVVEYLLR